MNTYGYIYKNDFNPLQPAENLLLGHNGSCNKEQFKLIIDLEVNTRYVLVVTTYRPKAMGRFSVFVSGPDNVSLNHLREYLNCFVNYTDRFTKHEQRFETYNF
jgi:hypothetical protein